MSLHAFSLTARATVLASWCFMSPTEAITYIPQIVTLRGFKQRMGDQRGTKVAKKVVEALLILCLAHVMKQVQHC